jgi:cell shape-determining protein MreC
MSEDIGRFTQTIRQLRIYVVIMLVVVVADVVGILRPIRGGLEYGLEITHGQVERLFEAVSVPWSTLTYWRSGVRRIADMEQRLAEVSVDYTRLKELEFENEQLKAVKGIVDQTTD